MSQPVFSEEMSVVIKAYKQIDPGNNLVPGLNTAMEVKTKGVNALEWAVLFRYYNDRQKVIGGRELGMGCLSCFPKVFMYIRELMKTLKVIE